MHAIGRVLRAHGLRGDLHVQLFRPRRHEDGPAKGVIYVGDQKETLKRARWISPDNVVLTLVGLTDRDTAEAKKGLLVELENKDPASMPRALADDGDLMIGARALDAESKDLLGTITSIEDNGAQAILVIESERGETLVPCVDAFVVGIEVNDAGERQVLIHAIPGLFDPDLGSP